jgi:hypothetical protein
MLSDLTLYTCAAHKLANVSTWGNPQGRDDRNRKGLCELICYGFLKVSQT